MTTKKSKAQLDQLAESLIGKRIKQVKYIELAYTDDNDQPLLDPAWDWDPDFDSLDHGLQFITEDDEEFFIVWDNDIACYGISIWKKPFWRNPEQECESIRIWDVTSHNHWKSVIGQEIIESTINWVDTIDDDGSYRMPNNLNISFENNQKVWIVALEFKYNTREWMPLADHITVFFSAEIADQFILDKYEIQIVDLPLSMLPSSSAIQAYKEKIYQSKKKSESLFSKFLLRLKQ